MYKHTKIFRNFTVAALRVKKKICGAMKKTINIPIKIVSWENDISCSRRELVNKCFVTLIKFEPFSLWLRRYAKLWVVSFYENRKRFRIISSVGKILHHAVLPEFGSLMLNSITILFYKYIFPPDYIYIVA